MVRLSICKTDTVPHRTVTVATHEPHSTHIGDVTHQVTDYNQNEKKPQF